MKSKLAYLCGSESWGGLEMNHVRNAKWMQDRGHEVCFLCVEGSRIANYAFEMKLNLHFISPHRKYYDFGKAKILANYLKSNHFSHLLIRSNHDMSIAATVKRKLGSAIQTAYFMEMQLGVKKTNILHTIRYRYIDVWSCPLNWLGDQVKSMTNFRNKLVIIPSGVELKLFHNNLTQMEAREKLDLPNNSLIFGLIGRFDPQKGQLLLLEATEIAKNKNFNIVLLGEPTLNEGDTYYNQMQAKIESEELQNRVFVRPFMKDVSIFFRAVDWFVMATKAETFGMVTIESLACGTPVIGSNAGGTPEILTGKKKHGGILFETQNAKDLAKHIDKICDENIQFKDSDLLDLAGAYDHSGVCEAVEEELGISA